MPSKPWNALLIATSSKIESFLPTPLFEELTGLFERFERIDSEGTPSTQIEAAIREFDPRIIITGWGTRQLPETPNPSLEYVCHLAGTVRSFFPRTYFEKGIRLSNWGSSIAPCVAEMALLGILNGLRKTRSIHRLMHDDRSWTWECPQSRSLHGKKVGIHGYGNIARELIALIEPFGIQVSVYSEPVPPALLESRGLKACSSLEELFKGNDVVVEVEALTPSSRASVKQEHLASIPDGGVFVNVGRGELVEEAALLHEAKKGRIEIVLDVYHEEPLPSDSPLRDLDNVQLHPHMSGPTQDFAWRAGTFALENIAAFLQEKSIPQGEITPEIFDRIT